MNVKINGISRNKRLFLFIFITLVSVPISQATEKDKPPPKVEVGKKKKLNRKANVGNNGKTPRGPENKNSPSVETAPNDGDASVTNGTKPEKTEVTTTPLRKALVIYETSKTKTKPRILFHLEKAKEFGEIPKIIGRYETKAPSKREDHDSVKVENSDKGKTTGAPDSGSRNEEPPKKDKTTNDPIEEEDLPEEPTKAKPAADVQKNQKPIEKPIEDDPTEDE